MPNYCVIALHSERLCKHFCHDDFHSCTYFCISIISQLHHNSPDKIRREEGGREGEEGCVGGRSDVGRRRDVGGIGGRRDVGGRRDIGGRRM